MSRLDWLVIAVHLLSVVGLGLWVSRHQKNVDDYYVGGRNLPWWAVAISAMATQTSANSFIGIPAFVALAPGGGLTWLQYELAVPLAMIVVMVLVVPFFRRLELISVYQYLEMRFDRLTRKSVSAMFLVSRGLAAGVQVYASGVVLSVCLEVPVWACILVMGVATTLYDSIGGMTAVVYADVMQMFILLAGILLCIVVAFHQVGSFADIIAAHEPARLSAIEWGLGLGDGSKTPFWGFVLGGFVLYVSYYGVDQSQAQRMLSAPSVDESKRALMFNGLFRFPLTLLYIFMGLAVGAVYAQSQELQQAISANRLDSLLPEYIRMFLPSGLRGILFAAILAAAISSLDSNLNSLSAATMRDFIESKLRGASQGRKLWTSKGITAFGGYPSPFLLSGLAIFQARSWRASTNSEVFSMDLFWRLLLRALSIAEPLGRRC
ncbi:MAG: sodium/solute symporter [Myxococcales bacterium]|nr:MAG: sodium/solute symporter [Myxococcales bacterium]